MHAKKSNSNKDTRKPLSPFSRIAAGILGIVVLVALVVESIIPFISEISGGESQSAYSIVLSVILTVGILYACILFILAAIRGVSPSWPSKR